MAFSISACSRDPRSNETDGMDYHFLGIDGFKKMVEENGFVEWEEVYPDQFYGTLKSEVKRIWNEEKAVLFDVDVYGGIALKKHFGDNALSIFVVPPSISELESRLRGRKTETLEKIEMRLRKAEEELSMKGEFDLELVNDNLNLAIEQAYQHIKSFLRK